LRQLLTQMLCQSGRCCYRGLLLHPLQLLLGLRRLLLQLPPLLLAEWLLASVPHLLA
jgi:hypothetical protein